MLTGSILALFTAVATAGSAPRVELAPLAPLVGPRWVGTFPDGMLTDEQEFEWVFGGKFLRNIHRVKDRSGRVVYEGETIYAWDPTSARIVWWYWNTTGGFITGAVEETGRALRFEGVNHAGSEQTAKVRSELRILDGAWESVSYFWRDEAWAERFRMTFRPSAEEASPERDVTDPTSVSASSVEPNSDDR